LENAVYKFPTKEREQNSRRKEEKRELAVYFLQLKSVVIIGESRLRWCRDTS